MVKAGGRTRPVQQLPEPSRFWIAYSPRTWRCSSELWTDLAALSLNGMQKPAADQAIPEIAAEALDDLLYLPPVDDSLAPSRDQWAASWVESGTSVLIQLRIDQRCKVEGANVIYDLLGPLLDRETERFLTLPEGSAAVWPLIPGTTDRPGRWDDGLALLAKAGVSTVQPVSVTLTPVQRRRLAEGRDESVFDALFHRSGDGFTERDFASYAAEHGLQVFIDRPPVGHVAKTLSNRELASKLALAGEIWLRLDRSMAAGQALFRAARGADTTPFDLRALVQEDNLKVIDWLNGHGRQIIEEWVRSGASSMIEELFTEYCGDSPAKIPEEE